MSELQTMSMQSLWDS